MRLVNCTNVSTPKLAQHGLLDQSIEVNGALVKPGASAEVPDAEKDHYEKVFAHLLAVGAVKWEEPAPTAEVIAAPAPEVVDKAEEGPVRNALVDMGDSSSRGNRRGR